MSHKLQWRKAIILSIVFHIFLVMGAGYLAAHMPISQAAEEKYVELELMNTAQPQALTDSVSPAMPTIPTSPSTPLAAAKQSTTSSSTSPSANTTPTVTTEGLTVTSVSGTAAGASSTEPAGNSNKTTGMNSNGSSIMPPSILNKIDPIYPQSARLAGIDGTVILTIQIYENGLPGNISIFRSSGNEELDKAAIVAVKQWRFVPAKDRTNNQPIICYTKMPISFHLK